MTRADVQRVRSLADKRGRDEQGLFVAEGSKLVGELLDSPLRVRQVYALDGVLPPGSAEVIAPKEMERLSLLKTPAQALALVEIPHYRLDPAVAERELVLALDQVQNPGNLGTIIRLADWFGIRHVVCSPDTADCFNPKVVQATMGAITRVEVHYADLEAFLAVAEAPVYGTFLEGENLYDAPLTAAGVVVMGNEGRGISPGVERHLTRRLFIPPYPSDRRGSESLNVAIATAVVCGEFRRRAIRDERGR